MTGLAGGLWAGLLASSTSDRGICNRIDVEYR